MGDNFTAVISGRGILCGAGVGVEAVWQGLCRGRVDCAPVPERLFATGLKFPVFTCPREPFPAAADSWLVDGELRPGTGRTLALALAATVQALDDAGIEAGELRRARLGIAIGTTVGCTFHDEDYFVAWRDGREPDLDPVRNFLGNNVAQGLHRLLGTHGPAMVITNACASSTDAIGLAANWIATGVCDLAVAGGSDELSRVALNGFASLMLTSDAPCRPFDVDRQGLNLGEGAAVMVLESAERLKRRAKAAPGMVRGYGTAADAWHPTAPHPEGRGLVNAIKGAISAAGLDCVPALINGHGTGTRANDQAETHALAQLFDPAAAIYLVSTKGISGHTLGAAGGVEAILTLEALRRGETPGTVGCHTPDPDFLFSPLPEGEKVGLASRIGISQSLAFGGTNSALVLEAF